MELSILLIHEDRRLPGQGGGAESLLRDQIKALTGMGHRVYWWYGQTDIASMVRTVQPDVCHVMTIHNHIGMHVGRYLQEQGVPHVWALMDYWPFCRSRMALQTDGRSCVASEGVCDNHCGHPEIEMPIYRETVNRSFVVALNSYTAAMYRRNGVRCDAVVELGIDTALFKPDPAKRGKQLVIMTSSAWPKYPQKGMDVLVEAAGERRIRMVTGLPREEVARQLQEAHIYVFPSLYEETWGLCLNEAMASGCACIASDVAGAKAQIEDGVTGLLVPKGDAKALRAAIDRLIEDKALRERLGKNAREHCLADHTLEAMGKRLEAVYREVI